VITPRISSAPPAVYSRVGEAVDLARDAGLELDDWQVAVLAGALGVADDGRWAAFEVGVDVSRQNGKGGILEARELAGLFLGWDRMITHSSHQFDTSLEAFRRLLELVESSSWFSRHVKRVSRSHGEEGIELTRAVGGGRIRFRTRTKGGGRGFSSDCVILDEAMYLPEATIGALVPTLSARRNGQIWYTGSAVDQSIHEHGSAFARVRRRGMSGDDGLAYYEWSVDAELDTVAEYLDDPEAWRAANPAIGFRIAEDYIAKERRAMDQRTFAVERLGVGDWPADGDADRLIDWERWKELIDNRSEVPGAVCLAFDVTPARSAATIAVSGRRADGRLHVETVEHRRGTGWVAARVAEVFRRNHVLSVACDAASPAASLVRAIENEGIEVTRFQARDYAAACGAFFDLIDNRGVAHLGTDELSAAVKNAAARPLGDAWAWSRRLSNADISPLVAVTIAAFEASAKTGSVYDERGIIAV